MKKKLTIAAAALVCGLLLAIAWPNQTTTLHHSVVINQPVETVYAALLQIDNVDEWVTPVLQAEYVSDQRATGAMRECTLEDGGVVREQVTHTIPNRLISMEMVQHELPVDFFKWDIRTERQSEIATRVTQQTTYRVRFGLIGVVLNQLAVQPSLDQTFNDAYAGLKTYLEKA